MDELVLGGLAQVRTVEDVEASVLAGRILADVAIEPLPVANSARAGDTLRPVAIPTDARDRLLGLANGVSPLAILERLLGRCAVALRRIPEDAETQLKHRLLSAMLDQGRALACDGPTSGNSAASTDDAGAHRREDDNSSSGGVQAAEREEMVRQGEITPFETSQVNLPVRTTTTGAPAASGRTTGQVPAGRRGGEGGVRRLKRAGEPFRQAPERITAVECPSCGRTITVRDGFTPDAELDAHIDRCSRSARTRRSHAVSDVGDGLNDSDHDEHGAQTDRARLRRLRRGGGSQNAAMRDSSSEEDPDGASPAKRRRDGAGRGREEAPSVTAPRQSAASHGVRHRARQQLLADDSNDVEFEERLESWWREFGDDDADGGEGSEGTSDYVLDGGLRVHGAVATRLYG